MARGGTGNSCSPETRSARGKVLSVFINLDPREFATPQYFDRNFRGVFGQRELTVHVLG